MGLCISKPTAILYRDSTGGLCEVTSYKPTYRERRIENAQQHALRSTWDSQKHTGEPALGGTQAGAHGAFKAR